MGTEPTIRVFVSSTQEDQQERHRQVVEIVEAFPRLEAVTQQRFTAEVVDSVRGDRDKVQRCGLVIFLLAHRYGSLPAGQPKSFVELEYDAAVAAEAKVDRLVFYLDEAIVPPSPKKGERNVDDGDDWELAYNRQKKLKCRATSHPNPQATPFTDLDLPGKLVKALLQWAEHRGFPLVAEPRSAPAPKRPGHAIKAYHQRVQTTYEHLPLLGMPQNLRLPVRLEDLWVPLAADHWRDRGGLTDDEGMRHGVGAGKPLLLVFADGKTRGFVLVGYPGSGKTTYLKKLALQCLTKPPAGLPADVLPVFLPLRQLRDEDLALGPEFLLARTLGEAPTTDDRDFYRWLLHERGNLLMLFDGLDEVPHERRERVLAWVREFARRENHWFGITSRPLDALPDFGADITTAMTKLQVRPLGDAEVRDFVTRWHRAVEPTGASERAGRLLSRLDEAGRHHIRLHELRSNPLLLTILCLVWRDRGEVLATERVELYQDCVQVLLDRWRLAGLAVPWTPRQALRILQPVALRLHLTRALRTSTAAIEPVVHDALDQLGLHRAPADFLREIGLGSGLFVDDGHGEFEFLHRALQEFLAARELQTRIVRSALRRVLDPDLAEVARQLVQDHGKPGDERTWWHEVVDLLLTLDGAPVFGPFVAALLAVPDWDQLAVELRQWCALGSERDATGLASAAKDRARSKEERALAAELVHIASPDGSAEPAPIHTQAPTRPKTKARDCSRSAKRGGGGGLGAAATAAGAGSGSRAATPHKPTGERTPLEMLQDLGMKFVEIPAGTFLMGSDKDDHFALEDERPQHRVTITQPFWLAATPVTNAQYRAFVEATGHEAPPAWQDRKFNGNQQPVVTVTWEDAQAFCHWAGLALPSEARWEYACRAGTTTPYWSGTGETDLARVGWYDENSNGRTQRVGEKPANAFGLCDMHGNVFEWCEDRWHASYQGAPNSGYAWVEGVSGLRVVRGGSWLISARGCRSAYRGGRLPGDRAALVGFRPTSSSLVHFTTIPRRGHR